MLQWFLRFSEFPEFNESSTPFRENSNIRKSSCVKTHETYRPRLILSMACPAGGEGGKGREYPCPGPVWGEGGTPVLVLSRRMGRGYYCPRVWLGYPLSLPLPTRKDQGPEAGKGSGTRDWGNPLWTDKLTENILFFGCGGGGGESKFTHIDNFSSWRL